MINQSFKSSLAKNSTYHSGCISFIIVLNVALVVLDGGLLLHVMDVEERRPQLGCPLKVIGLNGLQKAKLKKRA
jgi:hypothetical protein